MLWKGNYKYHMQNEPYKYVPRLQMEYNRLEIQLEQKHRNLLYYEIV